MPTLTVTFPRHHLTWRLMSISGISLLLLTPFWRNFKGRFLGPSLTDANSHGDICPGNICPGDICPYQEYLSCYCFGSNKFLNQNFFWPLNFWDLTFFGSTLDKIFRTNIFSETKFFRPNKFLTKKKLETKFFQPNIF